MIKKQFKTEEKNLRSALTVIKHLKHEPGLNISQEALEKGKQRLLMIMEKESLGFASYPRFSLFKSFRLAYTLMAVFALLIISGAGAFAVNKSLPNDPLYPIKISLQELRTKLVLREEEKTALQLTFIDARLRDVIVARERTEKQTDGLLTRPVNQSLVKVVKDAGSKIEQARVTAVRLEAQGEIEGARALAEKLEKQSSKIESTLSKLASNGSSELRKEVRNTLKKLLEGEIVAVKILASQEKTEMINEEDVALIAQIGKRVLERFDLIERKLKEIKTFAERVGAFSPESDENISKLFEDSNKSFAQAKTELEQGNSIQALLAANRALQLAIDAENELELTTGKGFIDIPSGAEELPIVGTTTGKELPVIDLPDENENNTSTLPVLVPEIEENTQSDLPKAVDVDDQSSSEEESTGGGAEPNQTDTTADKRP